MALYEIRRAGFVLLLVGLASVCHRFQHTNFYGEETRTSWKVEKDPGQEYMFWRDCAKKCAEEEHPVFGRCAFWTLQIEGDCFLDSDLSWTESPPVGDGGHNTGIRDESCLTVWNQDLLPINPTQGGWKLDWSDEFSGTEIDTNTWGFEENIPRGNDAGWGRSFITKREENARIEDGNLLLEAHRENWEGKKDGTTADYTAASLLSKHKKTFHYGRFSIRAKVPVASGMWPAWWFVGNDNEDAETGEKIVWPYIGEVDMFEFYRGKLHFNVMSGNKLWTTRVIDIADDFEDHFHTWTWDWTEDEMRIYMNGELALTYDVHDADGTGPNGLNPFQLPGFMFLSTGVGFKTGGDPRGTEFPQKFYVDWVRYWKWEEGNLGDRVVVQNGSGSGRYARGSAITISAAPSPAGFSHWELSGHSDCESWVADPDHESTTILIPGSLVGKALEITATAIYLPTPPTPSPTDLPTPSPTVPVCNWKCYLDRYDDLKEGYGDDFAGAEKHYYEAGKGEGRDCTCHGLPTPSPTGLPTPSPTDLPTPSPTDRPTPSPTDRPTPSPTDRPTPSPTDRLTPSPTDRPTPSPTDRLTPSPTELPTPSPTDLPTPSPTELPTPSPTELPTPSPTDPESCEPEYMGCYKDHDQPNRDLEAYVGTHLGLYSCRDECLQRNYKFFAMQWGIECWCGNDYGSPADEYPQLADSACQREGYDLGLGGEWSNSVYKTGC